MPERKNVHARACFEDNFIGADFDMDRYFLHWRHRRVQLNRLPVRHEDWKY
jgi:hypothetical protein